MAIFRLSRVRLQDIKVVLGLAAVFLVMNNLFVYLFSPEYGVGLYGSRTPLKKADWLAIGLAVGILALDLVVTFWDGSRYYNPFV